MDIATMKKDLENQIGSINEDLKNIYLPLETVLILLGKRTAFQIALELIDSLQQEQPEGLHFTPLNRLIQKIPSENWNDTVNNYARKLRDCLIKEGYRKDAEVLQGYISYMNGNNVPMATMDGQEQPQVADASKMEPELSEFEKAVDAIYESCGVKELQVKKKAAELLALAREELFANDTVLKEYAQASREQGKAEALKDLPRWKKASDKERFRERMIVLTGDNDLLCTNYAEEGEYYIPFSSLEKLPKEG